MGKTDIIKPYKEEFDYSYTSGAYGTIELLVARPELVRQVLIHPDFARQEDLMARCREAGIPVSISDEAFRRVNQKENSYVLGVFAKYACSLGAERPHVVLVNPSDTGNLGTIIRTMVGFNITDLAIITPAADVFNPKTVRATMGALFRLDFERFASFGEYRRRFPYHACFPFMLDGQDAPDDLLSGNTASGSPNSPFSLIFGNEATGLDPAFSEVGHTIRIPQAEWIDSLNVAVAFGIGAYVFAKRRGLI